MGGGERGNYWLRPRFDGRQKTRGGGPPARYKQKRCRTVVDRSAVRIEGGGQGCDRRRNGDSDGTSNGGENDDGRGMGGSSCDVRTRSGYRSRNPCSSGRNSSRGNAASGAPMTKSRSGLRSGSGLRSRLRLHGRRLRGGWSGRSRGIGGGRNDGDNDDNGNIGDDVEDGDDGLGGRRDSGNCKGNVISAESGMSRGGKCLILIPTASANSPPLPLSLSCPTP